MSAVRTALVVGAGLAGTAAAILLAEGGVDVELIDIKPDVSALGSGITLQGNALRELRRLGLWESVRALGYPFDTTVIRASDAVGTVLLELDDVQTGGRDLPAVLGMSRPILARLLVDRALEVGVRLRMGTTHTGLDQDDDSVSVTFSDNESGRYDVVIGADGIRSWTRQALGITLPTRLLGMGIWRVFGPRPHSVTAATIYYGGPSYIAGFCPTGSDSLYAYIVEPAQDRSALTPDQRVATMRELTESYHGPWDDIRADIVDPATVNYTLFETHVLPAPWNRGRVVLIGDAAHTCPPTLAQGGAQALEDAVVLAEQLLGADVLDQQLWDAFTDRRFTRASAVVDASNQLCQWLLDHEQGDVEGLMRSTMSIVSRAA